jgi:hypothetical protein
MKAQARDLKSLMPAYSAEINKKALQDFEGLFYALFMAIML